MVLNLLLTCHTPTPLPERVTLEPSPPPLLVSGRATWPILDAVPLRDGIMLGSGLLGALWLQDDGTTSFHGIGPGLAAGEDGRVLLLDPHGDHSYDPTTRTWGEPGSWPSTSRAPDVQQVADGVVTVDGMRFDAHLRGVVLTASERGDDGRVRIAFGPKDALSLAAQGLGPERSAQERPPARSSPPMHVVLTLESVDGGLREVSRWSQPAHAVGEARWQTDLSRVNQLSALATRGGITWAVWDQALGQIGPGDRWIPAALPAVRELVVHRDQLWAAGDGGWRLDGVGWTEVLAPWRHPSFDDPSDLVDARSLQQRWTGRVRPAMNGLLIEDGGRTRPGRTRPGRTCGDPSDHDRLHQLYGDCDAWIGLSAAGRVLSGDPILAETPPVGPGLSLVARGGLAMVGGRDGAATRPWPGERDETWTLVPGSAALGPITVVDSLGEGAERWFTDGSQVCRDGGRGSRCEALPNVSSLAAVPTGAWLCAEGELWYLPFEGRPVMASQDALPRGRGMALAVLYDPSREIVWVAGETGLSALNPETGAVSRRWELELGEVHGLALEPQGLRLFQILQDRFARFDGGA